MRSYTLLIWVYCHLTSRTLDDFFFHASTATSSSITCSSSRLMPDTSIWPFSRRPLVKIISTSCVFEKEYLRHSPIRESFDLLVGSNVLLQSRAKVHHVAVLTEQFVKFKCSKVFSRISLLLNTKFGWNSTPGRLSSFDCKLTPDVWTFGLWDPLRQDDIEVFCSLFDIQW